MSKDKSKPPRTAKPGTLLSQWWTLGAITADPRTAGRHTSVAWVIIDRFMQKHGNGMASIRYLEKATGLSQHTIIKACRELVEWGYFTQHIGSGTRATEYTPKWLVLHPSTALSSAAPICSTGAEPLCSTTIASAVPLCSESYLRRPADRPGVQEVESGSASPASPPLSAGLTAAVAEAPQEKVSAPADLGGFQELWESYGWKQQRAKAKAAYAKISPDPHLHATIVTEAARWKAHYEQNNVEPRWRVLLHNWLAGENWLQDLPIVHTDRKSAAIANVRGSAKHSTARNGKHGHAFPEGETLLTIKSAEVIEGPATTSLVFVFSDDSANDYQHSLPLIHHDEDLQEAGQSELARITAAAGMAQANDSKDFIGREIVTAVHGGTLKFVAPRVRRARPEETAPEPEPAPPAQSARPRPAIRHRAAQCFESDAVDGVVSLLFVMDKDGSELRAQLRLDDPVDRDVLAAICRACGHDEIKDTEQLHRLPIILSLNNDGKIVGAEVNTRLIKQRERGMAFIRRMQEEGWPEDEVGDSDLANAEQDDAA